MCQVDWATHLGTNLHNRDYPLTYTQSHTPTVTQGGLMDPPPTWFFAVLQYLENILPLVESLLCALQVKTSYLVPIATDFHQACVKI